MILFVRSRSFKDHSIGFGVGFQKTSFFPLVDLAQYMGWERGLMRILHEFIFPVENNPVQGMEVTIVVAKRILAFFLGQTVEQLKG